MPPRKIRVEIDDLLALCDREIRVALRQIRVGDRNTDDERKRIKFVGTYDLHLCLLDSTHIKQAKAVPVMCCRIIRIQLYRALELFFGFRPAPKAIVSIP